MLSVQVSNLKWCDVMLLRWHRANIEITSNTAIGAGETGFKKRKRHQKTNHTGISEFLVIQHVLTGELWQSVIFLNLMIVDKYRSLPLDTCEFQSIVQIFWFNRLNGSRLIISVYIYRV